MYIYIYIYVYMCVYIYTHTMHTCALPPPPPQPVPVPSLSFRLSGESKIERDVSNCATNASTSDVAAPGSKTPANGSASY